MTDHPGKTPAQRRVLDEMGCGGKTPRMSPQVRDALLRQGLIEQCGETIFQDRFGIIRVPEYEMTIAAHIQWCDAMAEQCGDDDD